MLPRQCRKSSFVLAFFSTQLNSPESHNTMSSSDALEAHCLAAKHEQRKHEKEDKSSKEKKQAFEIAQKVIDILGGVAKFALKDTVPKHFSVRDGNALWLCVPDPFMYTGNVSLSFIKPSTEEAVKKIVFDAMNLRSWTPEYRAMVERVAEIIPVNAEPYNIWHAAVCLLYKLTDTPMPKDEYESEVFLPE